MRTLSARSQPGYVTASVPVPIGELMQEIARAMLVQVH
jgi:hypothetical protein